MGEDGEGQRHQRQLQAGRGARHRHQRRDAALRAEQRQQCLHGRDQQRQQQRDLAKLGKHYGAASGGAGCTSCFLCAAPILSATSFGM